LQRFFCHFGHLSRALAVLEAASEVSDQFRAVRAQHLDAGALTALLLFVPSVQQILQTLFSLHGDLLSCLVRRRCHRR
jgi:hypothetical protein